MSSNVRFEQMGRTMYGQKFGYAIEYIATNEFGVTNVQFAGTLIMAEDPQNTKMPLPVDLVSECLFELLKEENQVIATMYGRQVKFGRKDTLFDIKRRIRELQMSLVKIDSELPSDIKQYIRNGIYNVIKGMPVH